MRLFFGNSQQRVDGSSAINADKGFLNFDSSGSPTQYINITTTAYGWSFVSAPAWISGGPTTGPVGTTEADLTASVNAGAERSGTIIINQNVSTKTLKIIVTQEGV